MRQAACLLLVLLSSPPLRAAELSPELRAALEQPLKEKLKELVALLKEMAAILAA